MTHPRPWRSLATAALALLVAQATAAPAAPLPASIPVHDVFTVTVPTQDGGHGTFEGAVHAAYSVPEGTVLYWSLREVEGSEAGLAAALEPDVDGLPRLVGGVLANPESARVLPALTVDDECLCTVASDLEGVDSHEFQTMFTTFPPVLARTVDVDVDGAGTVVVGVPVLDQTPEPLRQSPVVPLGAGWPTYPDEEVLLEAAGTAEGKAEDMVGRSGDEAGDVRVDSAGDSRLVSMEADVLFAWDKAVVTPEARATLADAADEIRRLGAERLVVTGHTDSTGDVARNEELSLQRAEAVREVLAEVLPDVRISAEGRGQWEPVASNDDPRGRAQNRRATIAYTGGGGDS